MSELTEKLGVRCWNVWNFAQELTFKADFHSKMKSVAINWGWTPPPRHFQHCVLWKKRHAKISGFTVPPYQQCQKTKQKSLSSLTDNYSSKGDLHRSELSASWRQRRSVICQLRSLSLSSSVADLSLVVAGTRQVRRAANDKTQHNSYTLAQQEARPAQPEILARIGLCSVLRPRQHSIGYMGDGFYRSKDPTNRRG